MSDASLLLFVLTTVLHGFIHGIVIGSFKQAKELILIMIFVIIYKIPLSIAIGTAIVNSGNKCCSLIAILSGFLFILSTPGGILCMMLIDTDEVTFFQKTEPTIFSIQAVIAGAFIYIACSNLLSAEFQGSKDIHVND